MQRAASLTPLPAMENCKPTPYQHNGRGDRRRSGRQRSTSQPGPNSGPACVRITTDIEQTALSGNAPRRPLLFQERRWPICPTCHSLRGVRASVVTTPSTPIHSNLMCADCSPPGNPGGNDPYFGTARTRPGNSTGASGITLGSRNFNWGLPIVGLKGRAGLDLSFPSITTR